VRLNRRLRIAGAVRRMAGEKVEPIPGERRAHPAPRQIEGHARPLAIALTQQRQVEQPFAGIIEDLEGDLGNAAGYLRPRTMPYRNSRWMKRSRRSLRTRRIGLPARPICGGCAWRCASLRGGLLGQGNPIGRAAGSIAEVTLEILDYPGEWLLDLPLAASELWRVVARDLRFGAARGARAARPGLARLSRPPSGGQLRRCGDGG